MAAEDEDVGQEGRQRERADRGPYKSSPPCFGGVYGFAALRHYALNERMVAAPAKRADGPRSSSMRSSALYFATRSERAGAPVQGFTRISDEPIKLHNFITNPDVIIILDNTLIGVVPVTDGLADDGIVIINTNRCPPDYVDLLGVPAERIWTVDATGISLDTIGRNIPNAPMLGALIKATGLVKQEWVNKTFEHKFGRKSPEVVKKNIKAIERAMEEAVNG